MQNICENLDVIGSINVQFKEKGSKIYPIEINSRFSGTTSIRQILDSTNQKCLLIIIF